MADNGDHGAAARVDAREFLKPLGARISDELAYPFSFESDNRTLRTAEKARPGVVTLLHRLGVPEPATALAADRGVERQLLLYGTEVLLNIDYYYARSRREERKQWAMNAGIYGLALVFVGIAIYLFVADPDGALASAGPIAAVVGAVLAGVKFLTESQDFQKTRSSFWQAGAELKMRLYTFIGEWCGRAWEADEKRFAPEFVLAVQDEIRFSRELQVDERRRFYELMATPTRLVGATEALSVDAQAAATAYAESRAQRAEQRRQHELEELSHERARLEDTYPEDGARPVAVSARLDSIDRRLRALSGETTVTRMVTAAVETSSSSDGAVAPPAAPRGVPFDGRRDD